MADATGDVSGTSRRGRAGGTAYLLAALVLLAVGAGGGLLLARLGTPDVLAAPTALSDLAVDTLTWDDPRPANLTLIMAAPQQVLAPRAGLLTASTCTPGGALRSGTVSFAVDGRPLLTLATSTPLWRDLPIGTSGADAAAVVAALREIGASVDGTTVTATVIAAYDTAAKAAGAPQSGGTIARDAVVWIPSAAATAVTCDASVGIILEPGRPLASLSQRLVGARLTASPADLVAGPRVFTVAGHDLVLGTAGVDADALAWLAAHPEQHQQGTTMTVNGSLRLATALSVLPVPPSALGPVTAQGTSCVTTPDGPRSVTVVGSRLGTAFVQPGPGSAIRTIILDPARARPCT